MSESPRTRKAFESAEKGLDNDVSRLVDSVPVLMREAARRRASGGGASIGSLAAWALPRLAAATTVAVIASGWVIVHRSRQAQPQAPKTFESVVLEGEGGTTGDVVFDAVLGAGRSDG